MSDESSAFPSVPVNIEDYTISPNLNFRDLYGGIWLYALRVRSHRIVLTAISAFYGLTVLNFIAQCFSMKWNFVINGDTRDSIFWSSFDYPSWDYEVVGIVMPLIFVISDGLLIWRCYHLWGESIKVTGIPVFLWITEIALVITDIVLRTTISQSPSLARAELNNHISTSLLFMGLATTCCTTFLIGYRIYTASENISRDRKRYIRILITIVESSAVYSFLLFLEAMVTIIPGFRDVQSTLYQAFPYIDCTLAVCAGLGPTVMVLRLTVANQLEISTVSSGNNMTHITGLNFDNSQNGGAVGNNGLISRAVNDSSVGEELNGGGEAPIGGQNIITSPKNSVIRQGLI
ncbi:hypothetical protein JR316_0013414 [Psilocybe cubensis]|uniref:Uncharacterized protein n=2 Tax=Psilocybe cubensis TaxID=181762 RepID=A0A8H7XLF1_PSICU|nr:uncharacterized protein JR316_0013414 [Psilocybe cubensis]KAH9474251.1 hypothetical protein JR316_0013414 [Psilocybe cubensis]